MSTEEKLAIAVNALQEISKRDASFADPHLRKMWQIEMASLARTALSSLGEKAPERKHVA